MNDKMEIVILDGHTLNPGDLSWEPLKEFGTLTLHERTTPGDIVTRCATADAVLTNKVPFTRETLSALPKLRYIGVTATGYNVIDTAAATERGIVVTNVPEYGTASVAQHTFALILELAHRVGAHAQGVRSGRWSSQPDFCYWDGPLVELHGLTLGIIGFGRIGQAVARIGMAFGMPIATLERRPPGPEFASVRLLPLDQLLAASDVLSLHCPLTPETKGIINAARLRQMKPGAFLINTSRGPLIVGDDLVAALENGIIAGAALDVLSVEPPPIDNPLLKATNCIITPHHAWGTWAARDRLLRTVVSNLAAFIRGKVVNRVG